MNTGADSYVINSNHQLQLRTVQAFTSRCATEHSVVPINVSASCAGVASSTADSQLLPSPDIDGH
jgi:hypothetical protein